MGYDPFEGDRAAQVLWPTSRELPEAPEFFTILPPASASDDEASEPASEAGYREPPQLAPAGSFKRATAGVAKALGLSLVLLAAVAFVLVYVGFR